MLGKTQNQLHPKFWRLLFFLFLMGCQNGEVTIKQLNIHVDGISFSSSYTNFTTPSIQKFTVKGLCSKDIHQVYFRFTNTENWTPVTTNNGRIDCHTDGTFNLNFDYPLTAIKESSHYVAAQNGVGPRLTLEFYGKTKAYRSKNTQLIVTQLNERGKSHVSISPESHLSSPSFKIHGRLSQFDQPTRELSSSNFKIKQGTLRTGTGP